MPTIDNRCRAFISIWHQRNLQVVDTPELEKLLATAARTVSLDTHFNGKMLVSRAQAELKRRIPNPVTA